MVYGQLVIFLAPPSCRNFLRMNGAMLSPMVITLVPALDAAFERSVTLVRALVITATSTTTPKHASNLLKTPVGVSP